MSRRHDKASDHLFVSFDVLGYERPDPLRTIDQLSGVSEVPLCHSKDEGYAWLRVVGCVHHCKRSTSYVSATLLALQFYAQTSLLLPSYN